MSPTRTATAAPTVADLTPSWVRGLRAANRSPRTIRSYEGAARLFDEFLVASGMPRAVSALTREHVEMFVQHVLATGKPASAANRYGALMQFFKWCVAEGELVASPMAKMRPPTIPETAPAVLTEAEVSALLDSCKGNGFEERRDMALILILYDTGARLGEVAALRGHGDVDLERGILLVTGKGRRERLISIGVKATQALDRYVRMRDRRPDGAALPNLWLGRRGAMTDNGIYQMVRGRARQAGIRDVNPHAFRHTFAHRMLSDGVHESDVMTLAGWRSRQMLSRYGRSAASERAIVAHKKHSPGDRL